MRRSTLMLVFALFNVAGGVANADDRLAATAQAMEAQLGAELGRVIAELETAP